MSLHRLELDVLLILAAFVYCLYGSPELTTEPTELASNDKDQVDFDARAREKRGVTICRIAGTGPCAENSECCSKVCVNHVCCLHSETCKMKDECRTKVPEDDRCVSNQTSNKPTEFQLQLDPPSEPVEQPRGKHPCTCKHLLVSSIGEAEKLYHESRTLGVFKAYTSVNSRQAWKAIRYTVKWKAMYLYYRRSEGYFIGDKKGGRKGVIANKKRTWECPYRQTLYDSWYYSGKPVGMNGRWKSDPTLFIRCIGDIGIS